MTARPFTGACARLTKVVSRVNRDAADTIGKLAIFNVKGNSYRLTVRVEFAGQRIYVKEFLTHAEYDKGVWKKWL